MVFVPRLERAASKSACVMDVVPCGVSGRMVVVVEGVWVGALSSCGMEALILRRTASYEPDYKFVPECENGDCRKVERLIEGRRIMNQINVVVVLDKAVRVSDTVSGEVLRKRQKELYSATGNIVISEKFCESLNAKVLSTQQMVSTEYNEVQFVVTRHSLRSRIDLAEAKRCSLLKKKCYTNGHAQIELHQTRNE